MSFLISDAFANAAPAAGPHQAGGASMLITFGLMFAVFYLFFIRPQNKRAKAHRDMITNLTVGDEVVTSGGLAGKVTQMNEQFVQVEIADNIQVKVQRPAITSILPKGTLQAA